MVVLEEEQYGGERGGRTATHLYPPSHPGSQSPTCENNA